MTGPGAWLITEPSAETGGIETLPPVSVERLPELPGIEFDDLFVPDPAAQATSSGSVRRR